MATTPVSRGESASLPAIVLLGIGLGGFFDGIVLHQILQWHHLLSAHLPADSVRNLEINTLADGLFHAATWVCTAAGLVLLWGSMRDGGTLAWRRLFGGLLAGWGGFNLVEGVVDHHVLQIHHVRPGPDQLLWDLAFLGWGAVMLVAGVVLLRPGASRRTASDRVAG
jgi:uncharacterized membrane protein